jgi:hypothetical protein
MDWKSDKFLIDDDAKIADGLSVERFDRERR